jgi:small nuclear ribonucleoprotein (snRNP)-like protein
LKRILRTRVRRQVLVTTKSGDTFRGVFFEHDSEAVVLRNAELADPRSDRKFIAANGEVVILVAEVAYLQFLS